MGEGVPNDIGLLELDAERTIKTVLATPHLEREARLSPDGQWLAYVSHESDRAEVYVRPFPGPGRKWQISTKGGDLPVWARDGRELFYRNGAEMMAVPVQLEPDFKAGAPNLLFEASWATGGWPPAEGAYDVTPDGQRFVMVEEGEDPTPPRLVVIPDFFDELQAKMAEAGS